jgi:hypothetical protein
VINKLSPIKTLFFYKSFYQGLPMRKQDFAHTNIYLTVTSTKDEHYIKKSINVPLKKLSAFF